MPPVPVYTASPINAASKASGITPKTEAVEGNEPPLQPSPSKTSSGSPTSYPPAQPGARPSLPVQTGVPEPSDRYRPTQTSTQADTSPPPPQPGAVPSPPGKSNLPPPPKAGESIQQQRPRSQTLPMPPQMLYPSPTTSYQTHQRGTSTSVSTAYSPNVPQQPTFLQSSESTEPDFSHPPGYQQNIHAVDFSRDQREAHNASFARDSYQNYEEEESIWNTAKKWAAAAGDSLAAAEQEVWKRINKD